MIHTYPNADMNENVVSAPEAHARNFVGMVVRFALRKPDGTAIHAEGEVIAQKWLGLTKRGMIPEYGVVIRGNSGRTARARVTRDYVHEVE